MPIQFKSLLSSQVTNETFLDKTIDDAKKGKLGLFKVANTDPDAIEDAQDFINEIADTTGIVGENDPNAKVYSSNNYIADGDNRKVAIGKLDTELLSKQTQIDGLSDILNAGEIILKAYPDDASYIAENGALPYVDKTAIYYNSTTGLVRYYDDVAVEWKNVGAGSVGLHESLGTGNGVTVDFSLTTLPSDENSFIVYRNGVYVPQDQYTFANPIITFNTAPAPGQRIDVWMLTDGQPTLAPIQAGTQIVEYRTLDATDIANESFTLSVAPSNPLNVIVDVISGSAQIYGIDFTVSGTTFSWVGLGMSSQVTIGSIIRYHYFS